MRLCWEWLPLAVSISVTRSSRGQPWLTKWRHVQKTHRSESQPRTRRGHFYTRWIPTPQPLLRYATDDCSWMLRIVLYLVIKWDNQGCEAECRRFCETLIKTLRSRDQWLQWLRSEILLGNLKNKKKSITCDCFPSWPLTPFLMIMTAMKTLSSHAVLCIITLHSFHQIDLFPRQDLKAISYIWLGSRRQFMTPPFYCVQLILHFTDHR